MSSGQQVASIKQKQSGSVAAGLLLSTSYMLLRTEFAHA